MLGKFHNAIYIYINFIMKTFFNDEILMKHQWAMRNLPIDKFSAKRKIRSDKYLALSAKTSSIFKKH